jgi:hypothetical protein
MLITILAMIKLTAAQTQIRLLRLIPGWKYASRSGPYHVGQGYGLPVTGPSGIIRPLRRGG